MILTERVIAGGITESEANNTIDILRQKSKLANYDRIAATFVRDADEVNIRDLRSTFKKSIGIDLLKTIKKAPIKRELNKRIKENIRLISSIQSNQLFLVRKSIIDNIKGKEQPQGRSLVEQIQHVGRVTKTRARLIARDQTSKLNTAVNSARQQALGITSYIWRTSKDERVVGKPGGLYPKGNEEHGNHWKREGKEFKWSKPPHDGHPGQPIQ